MSDPRYSVIPTRAVRDKDLTALDIRVLSILGARQDKQGWCFPSRKSICEWAHCAPNSVTRSIKRLVEKGYVETRARFDDRGQKSNDYRVKLDLYDGEEVSVEGATPERLPPETVKTTPYTLECSPPEPQGGAEQAQPNNTSSSLCSEDVAPAFELTPSVEKPKREKAEKRGARMRADWLPTNADREFAIASGIPAHRVDGVADEFRDYWLSRGDARACHADWSATWRNNVRKFLKLNPGVRNGAVILEHPNGSRTHHNQRNGNGNTSHGSGSGGSGSRPLSKAAMWAQIARQAQ